MREKVPYQLGVPQVHNLLLVKLEEVEDKQQQEKDRVEYLAVEEKVCKRHHKHLEIGLEDRLCRERTDLMR